MEAGEALGFLPGDLQEKIFPYLRPLYDALHTLLEPEELQRYMDRRMVEIAPLAYMRGRTLDHAFIVLDEAQNTTTEQMFMFLTRNGPRREVRRDRRPHPDRPAVQQAVWSGRGHPGSQGCARHRDSRISRKVTWCATNWFQSIIRAYRNHRYGEASPAPADERGKRKN